MTKISRRNFLKIGAAGTATAILAGCSQETERWVELEPYVHAPEEQLAGIPNWYASTCRMCPAGCGIIVRIMNGRAVKIEGNLEHPVNRGKLCARGQAGLQLLYNPDRITGAVRQENRGSRKFRPLPWNEAINTLYDPLRAAGSGVAIWTGSTTSSHLYNLFTRFAEAIGAEKPLRYDLYSGMNGYDALARANAELVGHAGLPSYDLSHADAVFSFGADFLGTWLNATGYSVEFGNFRSQPFGKRGYLVQFEPKMSITGAKADRWVPVKPGMEALVAAALIQIIAEEGLGSAERVARAAQFAGEVDVEAVAAACEMEVEELHTLARVFATADHPVALPGGMVTGGSNAHAATLAVQALNVIAGTVGHPGGMAFTPDLPVAELTAPAASSYADALALIERMQAGEIKVLLLHGANPIFDLPAATGISEALEQVEMIVSFNPLADETTVQADYVLPDRIYLEGWGYEVATPGFQGMPVVSGQQPVVGPLYDIHATGDVLLTWAQGLPAAAQALSWTDEVAFIKAMIAQLPPGAHGSDDVDVQWARFQQHGGWWPESAPEAPLPEAQAAGPLEVSAAEYQGDAEEYPLMLHPYLSVLLGDGSGASLPWLQGSPDPLTTVSWQTWVEINPHTADELDLEDGDVVRIESPHGAIEALVVRFPAIRPDTVAIPVGQGHSDFGRYAKERGSHPLKLIGAETDATGNHLAWANVRVKISKTGDNVRLALLDSHVDNEEAGGHKHIPF